MDGQAAGSIHEIIVLDTRDKVAVVAVGKHAGHGMLEV
jgi:hypothetical protein